MYKNDMVWKTVQHYLPRQYRLDDATMPEEHFLTLSDGNRIHLDVYSPQGAKATIILKS
ncbi:hypothetical protein ACE3MQ_16470 [Paenibacillus lentus]|uniref:hypothetical protein n=1 Tax=Paenibacillus lentus TaxID=1338368 RepID=UPI00365E30F9